MYKYAVLQGASLKLNFLVIKKYFITLRQSIKVINYICDKL